MRETRPVPEMRRNAVLRVIHDLVAERPDQTFWVFEVVERMRFSPHSAVDIRNTVTRTMCVNPRRPQARRAPDLVRVSRGRYRLLTAHERRS